MVPNEAKVHECTSANTHMKIKVFKMPVLGKIFYDKINRGMCQFCWQFTLPILPLQYFINFAGKGVLSHNLQH